MQVDNVRFPATIKIEFYSVYFPILETAEARKFFTRCPRWSIRSISLAVVKIVDSVPSLSERIKVNHLESEEFPSKNVRKPFLVLTKPACHRSKRPTPRKVTGIYVCIEHRLVPACKRVALPFRTSVKISAIVRLRIEPILLRLALLVLS